MKCVLIKVFWVKMKSQSPLDAMSGKYATSFCVFILCIIQHCCVSCEHKASIHYVFIFGIL